MILDLATVVDQLKTVCENDQERRKLLLNVVTMVCSARRSSYYCRLCRTKRGRRATRNADEFVLRIVDAAVLAMGNDAGVDNGQGRN